MSREPIEKWPKPGTPRPSRHARVWIEVELELARQRIAQLEQVREPAGDT